MTPNESEAEALTGLPVTSVEEARAAAARLVARGAGAAVITLGEKGALYHASAGADLVPAYRVGPVIETTGAGDAFNGGFAVGLARGMPPLEAVRFGCAVAGISVTRPGTAPSMPTPRGGRGGVPQRVMLAQPCSNELVSRATTPPRGSRFPPSAGSASISRCTFSASRPSTRGGRFSPTASRKSASTRR